MIPPRRARPQELRAAAAAGQGLAAGLGPRHGLRLTHHAPLSVAPNAAPRIAASVIARRR